MTAPVISEAISMTAPVITDKKTGCMAFTLPSSYTLESAPRPLNPEVTLALLPARTTAVSSFSGAWNPDNVQPQVDELFRALRLSI
jgi:hypothetical protein